MDLPTCLGSARLGLSTLAQKKRGDVFALGRKHKSAAGGEVENLRIAGNLHDHRTKAAAAQGIDTRTQDVGGVCSLQQKKFRSIDPQFGKASWRERAIFEYREILDDPEHVPGAAYALRSTSGETGCSRIASEKLVQGAVCEAAAQNNIDIRMPKRATREVPAITQDGV